MGILQRLTGRKQANEIQPMQSRPSAPPLRSDAPHVPPRPAMVTDGHWWSATPRMIVNRTTYVAGTAARSDAVEAAKERFGNVVIAQLVADPTNPHDKGAVGVWVSELLVGYVRRDVLAVNGASTLRRILDQEPPVTVWAQIETVQHPERDYLGVTLHHELTIGASKKWPFPVTIPPLEYAKVIGADDDGGLLALMQTSKKTDKGNPDRPELIVPGVLSLAQQPGGEERVEVTVDGKRIGGLSTQESARRVRVVTQVLETGRSPIAQVRLRSDGAYSRLTTSLLCMTSD